MTTLTISLPDQIAKRVDLETRRNGFATRSEFIRTLLRKHFVSAGTNLEAFQPEPLSKIKLDLAKSGKYSQKFIESVVGGLKKSSLYEG